MIFRLFLCIIGIAIISLSFFYVTRRRVLVSPKVTPDRISYSPQTKRTINISDKTQKEPISIKASTLPNFVINLIESKFDDLWKVEAAERSNLVKVQVVNTFEGSTLSSKAVFDETKKLLTVTPEGTNKIKPGLYTLEVTVKTSKDNDITITQDFAWGVLAINTDKGLYAPGDKVNFGMAVLGDFGRTKCIATEKISLSTARVLLTVTSPSGKITKLSTDDKSITGSGDCKDRSVTNKADFLASLIVDEVGIYKLVMEAEHSLGKRSIESSFKVQSNIPDYSIKRTVFPTRIYPKVDYPVEVSVHANKNYSGIIYDLVPENFKIYDISNGGDISQQSKVKAVYWNVNLISGRDYTFRYTIHFPQIAPEFYLIGPFTIGEFKEFRAWKIASDSIFQLVQEAHNSGSGSSIAASLPSDPTYHNLVIAICSRTNSASFSSPSGFTLAYNNSTSSPRVYMYYRVVPAGMGDTVTCSGSSGTIGIQLLEFSGNSISSVRDRRSRRNSTSCSSGAHTSVTPNITPSNPDELVVAAFAATLTTSVISHSHYTDSASSFNGGTFDSSWAEVVNTPPVSTNDTATFAASGGSCSNVIVSFNATVSVVQGSFQFFENKNLVDPDTVFGGTASENQNIVLNQPNYPFRLRVLLDVDSSSGTVLDIDSGDWILQYAPMPQSGDCADGVYNPVGTPSDGTPIAYNVNSNSGGNNAIIGSTVNDPTDFGYTTRLEDYAETWLSDGSEDITNHNLSIGNNQAGLFDFSLIDNSDGSSSVTYCLIVTGGDLEQLDAYKFFPTVTTIPLDVNIRSGSTIRSGTIIQ